MRHVMMAVAAMLVLPAVGIAGLRGAQDNADERNASGSLKTIATAEADFRSNDRDSNRVNDFWTGDIAGLYAIDNTSVGPKVPSAIKLIEQGIALADQGPNSGTLSNGNYSKKITDWGKSAAKSGYWYKALGEDLQVTADGGSGVYQQDTDGTGDLVHNTSRFGACAMPESYGKNGKKVFMINEGNTMFCRDFGKDVVDASKTPPTMKDAWDANWPKDADVAKSWGKLD